MRPRLLLVVVAAMLAMPLPGRAPQRLVAQSSAPAALSGVVSSAGEPRMEGVVVTARREGAPFSVSVVTDERGRYSFPGVNLESGTYALSMRAIGYDVDDPGRVTVKAGKTASLDLKLRKTSDLAAQLTSLEWVMSMPGTPEQKQLLVRRAVNCAFCHTFERVVRTHYTAEQWVPVIQRMATYNPDHTGLRRHQKSAPPAATAASAPPAAPPSPNKETLDLAAYLATINLSAAKTWTYELQTLPRPKGRATRVVITQYDLPRTDSVVHDLDVDSHGNVWYGDSGFDYVGKLDPKTGMFSEYPAPNFLPEPPHTTGMLDVQVDKDDNLWPAVFGSKLAKFDTKTQQWSSFDLPERMSAGFIAPFHGRDSGTVWANGVPTVYRLDIRSGKVTTFTTPYAKVPGPHAIYMIERDSQDNAYFFEFRGAYIGRIDAKTGEEKMFATPTRDSFPRRGAFDAQDRLWFGEFYADKIGMLDTRTEQFKEFTVPRQYIAPYFARPDGRGDIWTSSQGSDRLLRLNPATGDILEYLMPTYYDARKVVIDPSTSRVTVWLPNKNTGQIIRVQPLD